MPKHPIYIPEWKLILLDASASFFDEQRHMHRDREVEWENAITAARKARAKRIAEGRPRID